MHVKKCYEKYNSSEIVMKAEIDVKTTEITEKENYIKAKSND